MRSRTPARVVTLLLLSLASGSAAMQALTAADAWVRLPAAGATETAAFAVIHNPTMYDVYLVSAATEVAGAVEFRQGSTTGAQPIKEVTLAAYDKVAMTPDGVHVWLRHLKRPLAAGDTVAITFTTDTGMTLRVDAVVRAAP